MKLRKCYVFSFGKLQDVTFDFSDGLNTFKQDNGWGKSTLATFIKVIFYGLNDSKKNITDNERIKYKTWNSTQKFGGFIEFEWGGKEFKLERYFGKKASEDTISLTNLATGKSFDNVENLGARIFQIDEEGFLSTTYFSQKDFQAKSNTSITAKFNSVCEVQDSDAFDKALLKLEEKAKTYKKTGDKGLIADTKREIFAVGEQIQKLNLASKTAVSLQLGVDNLNEEVAKLKEETTALTQKVTDAGKVEALELKKEQYREYLSKRQTYLARKNELEAVLNGQRVSDNELSVYFDCCNELNKAKERENYLARDIDSLKSQQQPKSEKKGMPKITLIMLILAILFVGTGVGLLFTQLLWLSIVLFVLTAVCTVVGVLCKFLVQNKQEESNVLEKTYLEKKISEYNEYKDIRINYERNMCEFLSKFALPNVDYFTALSIISSANKNVSIIDRELSEINLKIIELEKEKTLFDKVENTQNISELQARLDFVQDEYARKSNELARKNADIKYYQEQADRLSEFEDRREELLAKQAQYKEEYQIILQTLEFLTKADENLKVKYRAPLEESLNKYLALISGSQRTALIDIDLNVTIQENGGAKQTEYYSKGEQNLFEICKRFALTDVLFTGEKPFIILDDPFYNLDDEKLKQAIELVKKLSNEYQILYFVCHESRRA